MRPYFPFNCHYLVLIREEFKIVHCQINTQNSLPFQTAEVSSRRCSSLLQLILKSLMVPGPLALAWLIITSIDYIHENRAGQSKRTAFLGANTSSDAACHKRKNFQLSFWHVICFRFSDLSNLKFPMLRQSTFPESTSWHIGFRGYKDRLNKVYLEMQYSSQSSGKHLSPMPQSYKGRKKGTGVELSWTQSSRFCSCRSERKECKKVRDLFQPRSHSL